MTDRLVDVFRARGLDALYQGHPDGIFLFDLEGHLVDCNDASVSMTGATKEELLEGRFQPIQDPAYRARRSEYLAYLARGETVRYVTPVRSKDGTSSHVEVTNVPFRDATGRVIGALGFARDVSDLRQALDQINASQVISRIAERIARFAGWKIDVATGALEWSEELFVLLGVDPSRTPGYDEVLSTYYFEPYRSVLDAAVTRCGFDGTPFDVQSKIRKRNGDELDVRILGEAVRGDDGVIVRIDGAFFDITAEVHHRNEMVELERRVASTLNEIAAAIYFVARTWRVTFVNRAGLALARMSADELMSGPVWELFPGVFRKSLKDVMEAAMNDDVYGSGVEYVDEYGAYLEVTAIPATDGVVVSVRDVTVEHEAQQRIADFTERVTFLAQMLDLAKDAMIVNDFQEGITYWNKSAEELYGWTFDEVKGRPTSDVLYPAPEVSHELTEAVLRDDSWSGTVVHHTRDGRLLTIDSRRQLIRDGDGRPKGIFGVNTDVTASTLEKEARIRAQRMESIGTLAGGIAHDLNNVLAPILMSIEILERAPRDERERSLLASIRASANRGATMIRQVLSFAEGVDGDRESLSVVTLLTDLNRFCRDTISTNIDVAFESGDRLPTITGDHTQLMRVFINLITNARDAIVDRGQIRVRAFNVPDASLTDAATASPTRRGAVAIEVVDSGEGMDESTLERIFEPFFTTKEVGAGTGFGLSTSLKIVQSHGGRIEIESRPGHGSTFRVLLPAADGHSIPTAPLPAPPSPRRGEGQRILVVDDEIPVLMMLQEVLKSEGYEVDVECDGAAALLRIADSRQPYELIISDLTMPRLNGESLAREVRQRNPAARFIFISGLNASASVMQDVRDNAVSFLQKPFATDSLLGLVSDALS